MRCRRLVFFSAYPSVVVCPLELQPMLTLHAVENSSCARPLCCPSLPYCSCCSWCRWCYWGCSPLLSHWRQPRCSCCQKPQAVRSDGEWAALTRSASSVAADRPFRHLVPRAAAARRNDTQLWAKENCLQQTSAATSRGVWYASDKTLMKQHRFKSVARKSEARQKEACGELVLRESFYGAASSRL